MSSLANSPVIETAVASDAAGIADCVTRAYQHYVELIGKPPGPMLDDYAKVIREHLVYVAKVNHRVVGALVLQEQDGEILLDNVAISPGFQGQGLGKRLISFAELQAQKLGYSSLSLYTHIKMTENIEIYKKMGYAEMERREVKGYQRIYFRKWFENGVI